MNKPEAGEGRKQQLEAWPLMLGAITLLALAVLGIPSNTVSPFIAGAITCACMAGAIMEGRPVDDAEKGEGEA